MTHPFPAYLEVGYLYPTTIADDPFIPDGFELTTVTFPFLGGPEYPFTEKAVLFRPERSVIDGFRFFNFSVRPGSDHIWRGQTDHNGIKILYISHVYTPYRGSGEDGESFLSDLSAF
jgi:hypothetical protein